MRILQVVAFVSPDGSYGGPSRVALAQAAALAQRGHDVTVVAGAPFDAIEETYSHGFALRLFPAKLLVKSFGFAALRTPALLAYVRRHLDDFDVVHVHLARDLTTLPVARILRKRRKPYVVQTHGMIDRPERLLAWPVDLLETRSALQSASAVLSLTEHESNELSRVAPFARVMRIRNGVEITSMAPYSERRRIVLFLARLHPRKRAVAFVDMASEVLKRHSDVSFVIAGPDEGDADAVNARVSQLGVADNVRVVGAVDPAETRHMMDDAKVFVLPSVGEVFPMSVLEAFQAGTPVVVTNSLGIAASCIENNAAVVTDGSPESMAEAVIHILADNKYAESLRAGAERYLKAELDIKQVAYDLEKRYSYAIAKPRSKNSRHSVAE